MQAQDLVSIPTLTPPLEFDQLGEENVLGAVIFSAIFFKHAAIFNPPPEMHFIPLP